MKRSWDRQRFRPLDVQQNRLKAAAKLETWEMIMKKEIKLLASTLEFYSLF